MLAGFAAGGDDHLPKPFHVSELLARLRAPWSAAAGPARPPAPTGLHLDPADHALTGPAGRHPLTPDGVPAARRADGLGRDRSSGAATWCCAGWPDGAIVADNTLDQYVARLRRKVTAVGDDGRRIGTVHGVGLPLHVSVARRSLRNRLAWSASVVVALWVVVLTVGGQPAAHRRAGAAGRRRAPRRAPRRPPRPCRPGRDGGVLVNDTRDDRALDTGTWIFAADGTAGGAAGRQHRRPRSAGRRPRRRGRGAADTEDPDPVRLLALPVRDGGAAARHRGDQRVAGALPAGAAARPGSVVAALALRPAGRRPPGAAGQRRAGAAAGAAR